MISGRGHWHNSYGLTVSLLGLLGFVLVQKEILGQGFYGLHEDDYPGDEETDEYLDDIVIDERIRNETLTGGSVSFLLWGQFPGITARVRETF